MPIPSAPSSQVKRRLLREEAYEAIRDAILDGTLALGERLEDQKLQEWLHISRTPIRDALNQLAREGLVVVQAQSHTSVIEPDPERAADIVQTLGTIMGGVMRVTLPATDDRGRTEILQLIERAQRAVAADDVQEHIRAIFAIYDSMIERCPNATLRDHARTTSRSFAFQIRIHPQIRVTDWSVPAAIWPRLAEAVERVDLVGAQLAFQELHSLPTKAEHPRPFFWDHGASTVADPGTPDHIPPAHEGV